MTTLQFRSQARVRVGARVRSPAHEDAMRRVGLPALAAAEQTRVEPRRAPLGGQRGELDGRGAARLTLEADALPAEGDGRRAKARGKRRAGGQGGRARMDSQNQLKSIHS
jgi:hypothetical protein